MYIFCLGSRLTWRSSRINQVFLGNCWILLLVGGLEHVLFFIIYGNFIIPTDELILFRGVGIPPTSLSCRSFDFKAVIRIGTRDSLDLTCQVKCRTHADVKLFSLGGSGEEIYIGLGGPKG